MIKIKITNNFDLLKEVIKNKSYSIRFNHLFTVIKEYVLLVAHVVAKIKIILICNTPIYNLGI